MNKASLVATGALLFLAGGFIGASITNYDSPVDEEGNLVLEQGVKITDECGEVLPGADVVVGRIFDDGYPGDWAYRREAQVTTDSNGMATFWVSKNEQYRVNVTPSEYYVDAEYRLYPSDAAPVVPLIYWTGCEFDDEFSQWD